MIRYLLTRFVEAICYAVIFGGVAFGWIATSSGMN